MSTTPPPQADAPAPRQVKKRIYIPLILLVLLVGLSVGFYIRGTWADDEEKNPTGPDAGTLTQLLLRPDGNVEVRCAVVVNAPPKDTWAVVSDYNSHAQFLPYVVKLEGVKQPDGKFQIDGVAHSSMWGSWPFQSLATHEETPADGVYSASWSETDKDAFVVNRGGWSLKPIDEKQKQTLLAFSLQVELKDHPNFMVRNVIMDRIHSVLKEMRDETIRRKLSK